MEQEMTIQRFMDGIALPGEGQEAVRRCSLSEQEMAMWKELFWNGGDLFYEKAAALPSPEAFFLCLYVRLAVDVYGACRSKGISEKIYLDTFSDFTIWFRRCRKDRGKLGLCEERWLSLPIRQRLFRLGRLQFEVGELKEPVALAGKDYPMGTPALHVHIPEGEPLCPNACEDAFLEADAFFGRQYRLYDCCSWLLSPQLHSMLPPGSNVLLFQGMFEVIRVVHPFPQAEERVFGKVLDDKTQYPETTSLQRALKVYLQKNQEPGIGYGIRYRKSE